MPYIVSNASACSSNDSSIVMGLHATALATTCITQQLCSGVLVECCRMKLPSWLVGVDTTQHRASGHSWPSNCAHTSSNEEYGSTNSAGCGIVMNSGWSMDSVKHRDRTASLVCTSTLSDTYMAMSSFVPNCITAVLRESNGSAHERTLKSCVSFKRLTFTTPSL